jgi:prevent-host-death family protein
MVALMRQDEFVSHVRFVPNVVRIILKVSSELSGSTDCPEAVAETMSEHAIDVNQALTQLRELVRQAARGEDVILTEAGEPVAKIISINRAMGQREFGSVRGLIHMADDFDDPLEEFEDYT